MLQFLWVIGPTVKTYVYEMESCIKQIFSVIFKGKKFCPKNMRFSQNIKEHTIRGKTWFIQASRKKFERNDIYLS